jgi:aryl-alcohol dehydrogenase-like predicted oxidoreductase
MIPLSATDLATRAFPEKHPQVHASHYRKLDDLVVSSIGLGTRLGSPDDSTDEGIALAVTHFFRQGGNIIDMAVSDRGGRSERIVGEALARELSTGRVSRREVVLCTKGGFLTRAEDVRATYIDSGIVSEDEIVGGMHCIAPAFLRHQIERSRVNLQCETVDLYYLHNPETQAAYVDREFMTERIGKAIACLEEAANDGAIRRYGISTWNAFRVAKGEPEHLELAELVSMAESVAGSRHHFRAIQVPYNAIVPGAAFKPTQTVYGHSASVLEAADELGIDVIVSTPLGGGSLASELPPAFHHAFPRFPTDAQRALDFVVSTPQVTSVMVGMKGEAHVEADCAVMREPALSSLQWAAEIDQLTD